MSNDYITTHSPSSGDRLQNYITHSVDEVAQVLDSVSAVQPAWAACTVAERIQYLRNIAKIIRDQRDVQAELIVAEMGKPISEALAEVDKCALVFEYYADKGPELLAEQDVATAAKRSWVAHEPLGVIFAIMPWNFPWWQVARFAAPALLLGNTAILKHASNVTGCGLAIEKLFNEAGLPENVFRTIVVHSSVLSEVTNNVLADDRVAAVSFTGSEWTGAKIAAVAGKYTKKCVLELGGSDPLVVLADANIEKAVQAAAASRFLNGGQSCLCAKRLIVAESVLGDFVEGLVAAVDSLSLGDPMELTTDIGPLAQDTILADIENQINKSVQAGARLVRGGKRIEQSGNWFEPAILTDLSLDMAVMKEETFGPAAAVLSVSSDEEAIQAANSSCYGLGASVWSNDTDRALAIGRKIMSGALFINSVVASDPRLPFGGTKRSGYGRELGAYGILEFANTRTYYEGKP